MIIKVKYLDTPSRPAFEDTQVHEFGRPPILHHKYNPKH